MNNGFEPFDGGEVNVGEGGETYMRGREICAVEMRAAEIRIAQVGPAEIRPTQVGSKRRIGVPPFLKPLVPDADIFFWRANLGK